MLIFGVFLAWETRNVHHPALNDSKNIALAVYNVFMFSFLGFVVTFAVEYPSLRSLINRSVVFAGTTSTICLLFVPKVRTISIWFPLWVEKSGVLAIKKGNMG